MKVKRYAAFIRQLVRFAAVESKYRLLCAQYGFSSRGRDAPGPVLVNGSPKTGTTWMLKLVSSLPGHKIAAGHNFHGDLALYRRVLPGDVVHGHEPFSDKLWDILLEKGMKVILLIRDPRDQTVSRMFHIRRDPNHVWHQRMKTMPDDEALMACIAGSPDGLTGAKTLIRLTQSWLRESNKAVYVKYEDMITVAPFEFERVIQHLGLHISARLTQAIVDRNSFKRLSEKPWKVAREPGQNDPKSHFRKGIVGDWRNYFKVEHIRRFKELAGEELINLQYEQDYDW